MLKLIAFDYDGTLADSVTLCLENFDRVFAKYLGEKAPPHEEILQYFGRNEPGVLGIYLGDRTPEAMADFCRINRELHRKYCPDPIPGCRELLTELKKRGLILCIITGRSEETCRIALDELGLNGFFDHYQYGAPEKNDKAAQLRHLLDVYSLKPEEIAYVGDAVSDAQASREAGVQCFSAAWASTAQIEALERINPGMLFFSPESLLDDILKRI